MPLKVVATADQQRYEAWSSAIDQLRRGKSAIAASLHGEYESKRIAALSRAYEHVERAMQELQVLQ